MGGSEGLEHVLSGRRYSPRALSRVPNSNRFKGGIKMKPSTENEIAGRVHEVKGKIEEKVGKVTNDPNLVAEGVGEYIVGKAQKKIGQVQKVVEKP
jgi:uncharacterized protein YjbJ (UPF0337 family)